MRIKQLLLTTHVDRQGDQFAREGLAGMVNSIRSHYLPVGIEHDPRVAPIGRIVDAEVVELPDGEQGVLGVIEIFEPGDDLTHCDASQSRELPIREHTLGRLWIGYDRNYRNPTDLSDIQEVARILGGTAHEEMKKSVDPIAILTIGGSFIAGGILTSMLSKLGEDAYAQLKTAVKRLMGRKEEREGNEKLLQFLATVQNGDRVYEVHVLLCHPTDEHIDGLLGAGLRQLDQIMARIDGDDTQVRRLVFEFADGKLELKFGVRRDCVPMKVHLGARPPEERNP